MVAPPDLYHTPCYLFLDDIVYSENRTVPSRSISQLSYSSCGSVSIGGHPFSSSYLAGPDDSEEEGDHCQPYPLYQGPCSHTSQESLNSAMPPPQVYNIPFHIKSSFHYNHLAAAPDTHESYFMHCCKTSVDVGHLSLQVLFCIPHQLTHACLLASLHNKVMHCTDLFGINQLYLYIYPTHMTFNDSL